MVRRGGSWRRRLQAAATTVALVGGSLMVLGEPASAATCTDAQLVPVVHSTAVTEGLGTYTPLIRGKSAVVRVYLTLPNTTTCTLSTAQALTVTSATLTLSGGGMSGYPRPLSPVGAGLEGDPEVRHCGRQQRRRSEVHHPRLDAATDGPDAASDRHVQRSRSTTRGRTARRSPPRRSTTSTTATVNQQTNGLRILAIPLGDASKTNQFSAVAQTALTSSMTTLGRIYPVPDGVGPLNSTADPQPGIRYNVSRPHGPQGSEGRQQQAPHRRQRQDLHRQPDVHVDQGQAQRRARTRGTRPTPARPTSPSAWSTRRSSAPAAPPGSRPSVSRWRWRRSSPTSPAPPHRLA